MPQQTKTFRIFVSSTFTDMKEERELLQKSVFPQLEKFCKERGASFQAVDLRWGVNEESQLNQKTLDICFNEIARCQSISPKLNFLILLGERYGWQPVPPKIPKEEMDMIRTLLIPNSNEKMLIDRWYQLDENALPFEYVLQAREGDHEEHSTWEKIEKQIRDVLRTTIENLPFTASQRIKYFTSATHQEIIRGALNPPQGSEKSEEHVFAFSRHIKGLPDDTSAKEYIDVTGEKPDIYSQKMLTGLKEELVAKLGNHYVPYSASWKEGKSVMDDPEIFKNSVYTFLKAIIEQRIKEVITPDEINHEASLHGEFKARLTERFHGRDETLNKIKVYLRDSEKRVFSLIGESGSGKSSVIAEAIRRHEEENPYAVLIYRFIGTTSGSSNIISLLQNICGQIIREFNTTLVALIGKEGEKILTELNGLITVFSKCMALATPQKPITLFLDALDQLSETDTARSLHWLPKELPEHAKIVVSALPGLAGSFSVMYIEHLPLLPVPEAEQILDLWFNSIRRRLTPEQTTEITQKFAKTKLPIYLRLAFERASHWHSYDDRCVLKEDAPGIVNGFFDDLEKEHTQALVRHVISYMLCGRYGGLSEDEIMEILVFDKEFWEKIFLPNTRVEYRKALEGVTKIPTVVWSRLFLDMEPFLTERDADGVPIITFFHRQFFEVLRERYQLAGDDNLTNSGKTMFIISEYHIYLAEYFKAKPLYLDEPTRKTPNIRKLIEQLQQQIKGELWEDVNKTLCDFRFIEAKCAAKMVDNLLADYHKVLTKLTDTIGKAVSAFRKFVQVNANTLRANPRCCLQLAILEPPGSPVGGDARQIMTTFEIPCLDPIHLNLPSVDCEIRFMKHKSAVQAIAFDIARGHLISSDGDEVIRWDSGSAAIVSKFTLPKRSEIYHSASSDRGIAIAEQAGSIVFGNILIDANSGLEINRLVNGLISEAKMMAPPTISRDSSMYAVCTYKKNPNEKGSDHTVTVVSGKSGNILAKLAHSGVVKCAAFSPDSRLLITTQHDPAFDQGGEYSTGVLRVWDIEACREIYQLSCDYNNITFSPDGTILLAEHGHYLYSLSTANWNRLFEIYDFTEDIRDILFLDTSFVITRGKNSVTLRDVQTRQVVGRLIFSDERGFISTFALSRGNERFAMGFMDGRIEVWSVKTLRESQHKGELSDPYDKVKPAICMAFAPDNLHVAICRHNHSINIVDVGSGTETVSRQMPDEFITLCFTPDGQSLILVLNSWRAGTSVHVGGYSFGAVRRLSMTDLTDQATFECGRQLFLYEPCVISPDGMSIFIFGGHLERNFLKNLLHRWHIISFRCAQKIGFWENLFKYLRCLAFGAEWTQLVVHQVHQLRADNLILVKRHKGPRLRDSWEISPDGSQMVWPYPTICIWSFAKNRVVFSYAYELKEKPIFSPDGTLIAGVGKYHFGENEIKVISIPQSIEIPNIELKLWRYGDVGERPLALRFSPDGRKLLLIDSKTISVFDIRNRRNIVLEMSNLKSSKITCRFSPNGLLIFGVEVDFVNIWNSDTGSLLALLPLSNIDASDWSPDGGLLGVCQGDSLRLFRLLNMGHEPPIVTSIRIFQFGSQTWQKYRTAVCAYCGIRFIVPTAIINTIASINHNAGICPKDSPCLKLPDEAWEEPRLLSECSKCHKPLRLNPFIVDNRKYWWKFWR